MADPDDETPTAPYPETAADDQVDSEQPRHGLIDRMRGMGVGVEDPNIVGDVGPTDVPPGADPPAGAFGIDEKDEDDSPA
jgi:hypothetical protein